MSEAGSVERVADIMGGKIVASVTPVFLGLLGVVIANLPFSILGGLAPPPLLALMPVYFWCLVRPDLMSPGWVFVIGVLQDVLSGGPPGVWALSFVAAYALTGRQRDSLAGLSGWAAILGFGTVALVACASAYGIVTVYYWRFPPTAPVVSEFAITVLFYVPVAFLLGAIQRHVVGPLRSDF